MINKLDKNQYVMSGNKIVGWDIILKWLNHEAWN